MKQILVFKDNSTVYMDFQYLSSKRAPTQGIVINIDEWSLIQSTLPDFDNHFDTTSKLIEGERTIFEIQE